MQNTKCLNYLISPLVLSFRKSGNISQSKMFVRLLFGPLYLTFLLYFCCSWSPCESPSFGIVEMKRWKTLLELDEAQYNMQVVIFERNLAILCL